MLMFLDSSVTHKSSKLENFQMESFFFSLGGEDQLMSESSIGNFTIQQHGAKGKILIIRLSGEVNWPNSIRFSEL